MTSDDLADVIWRRSSRSGESGNCIEVALPRWRKSSRSGDSSNCVEVATTATAVGIRDSKRADGPVLSVNGASWASFLAGIKAGEFDHS
ncbi:MAG: DUF397 domain-containing protein [Micromonosporaceae bacterium]|nr:DUF397 domain-containing protein [Micromonosporaceae bacterium]